MSYSLWQGPLLASAVPSLPLRKGVFSIMSSGTKQTPLCIWALQFLPGIWLPLAAQNPRCFAAGSDPGQETGKLASPAH